MAASLTINDSIFEDLQDEQPLAPAGPATPTSFTQALPPKDEAPSAPPDVPIVVPRIPSGAKNASPTPRDLEGCQNIIDLAV